MSGSGFAFLFAVVMTATGLNVEFTQAAKEAHTYMESQLIQEICQPRFPSLLAVSRSNVEKLRPKVTSDADRGVLYVLLMAIALAAQSHQAQELARTGRIQWPEANAARDAANECRQCMSEANGWLTGDATQVAVLQAGPCLQRVMPLR